MTFDRTKLGLSDANMNPNLPRKWAYTSTDTAAVIDTAGYFNNASDLLKVGDEIKANVDTDGTPGYGKFFVSANSGGVVDVNDISTLSGGTDTD